MAIQKILTKKEEEGLEIFLIIRDDLGVLIDSQITPIYCSYCEKQVNGLFHLQGSRYGNVGIVHCSCGSEIQCTDSDSIVEYIITDTYFNGQKCGSYHIDLKGLYKLDYQHWELIKKRTGFNMIKQYFNRTILLRQLLRELPRNGFFHIESERKVKSDIVFTEVPKIITEWHQIIERLS